jgi:hypothetical protein
MEWRLTLILPPMRKDRGRDANNGLATFGALVFFAGVFDLEVVLGAYKNADSQ